MEVQLGYEVRLALFDSPYTFETREPLGRNWREGRIEFTGDFWTDDDRVFEMNAYVRTSAADGKRRNFMEVEFSDNTDKVRFDLTGGGDQMRILATIMDFIDYVVKNLERRAKLFPRSYEGQWRVDGIHFEADEDEPSRVSLYKRMARKYLSKLGFRSVADFKSSGRKHTVILLTRSKQAMDFAKKELARRGFI